MDISKYHHIVAELIFLVAHSPRRDGGRRGFADGFVEVQRVLEGPSVCVLVWFCYIEKR
jgi:hypothetical protein